MISAALFTIQPKDSRFVLNYPGLGWFSEHITGIVCMPLTRYKGNHRNPYRIQGWKFPPGRNFPPCRGGEGKHWAIPRNGVLGYLANFGTFRTFRCFKAFLGRLGLVRSSMLHFTSKKGLISRYVQGDRDPGFLVSGIRVSLCPAYR